MVSEDIKKRAHIVDPYLVLGERPASREGLVGNTPKTPNILVKVST